MFWYGFVELTAPVQAHMCGLNFYGDLLAGGMCDDEDRLLHLQEMVEVQHSICKRALQLDYDTLLCAVSFQADFLDRLFRAGFRMHVFSVNRKRYGKFV